MVEYGGWMVEVIPTQPYNLTISFECLLRCLQCSKKHISKLLEPSEKLLSLSVYYLFQAYPILGKGDYYEKYTGKEEYSIGNQAT
jgi:hypothetical protein